jgi:hypothetical protein
MLTIVLEEVGKIVGKTAGHVKGIDVGVSFIRISGLVIGACGQEGCEEDCERDLLIHLINNK